MSFVDTAWPALALGLAIGLVMRTNTTEEESHAVIDDEPPVQPPIEYPAGKAAAPKAGLVKIAAVLGVVWWLTRRARARRGEGERQS